MEYREGDIVVDKRYKEIFAYHDKRDKTIKSRLRMATQEEASLFIKSGKESAELKDFILTDSPDSQ